MSPVVVDFLCMLRVTEASVVAMATGIWLGTVLHTLPECLDLFVRGRSEWEGLRVPALRLLRQFSMHSPPVPTPDIRRRLLSGGRRQRHRTPRKFFFCVFFSRKRSLFGFGFGVEPSALPTVVPIIGLKITRVKLATEKLIESLPFKSERNKKMERK